MRLGALIPYSSGLEQPSSHWPDEVFGESGETNLFVRIVQVVYSPVNQGKRGR